MGIFFDKNKFKSLLELKINGEEMNYDDEENNKDKPEGDGEDNKDNADNTEKPTAEDDIEEEPENDYKIDDAENDAANDTEDATATPEEEPSENTTDNDYKIDDVENDTTNNEFEGNPEDNTDTEEEPVDNTEDDYKIDDAENDAANDDTPDDGTNTEEDTTEDDYKIDDADGETPEGEEAPTDTSTDDETSVDSEGGTDKSSELKDIEKELFKDLSPEQIQIREKELKSKYLELYNTINDIITRTGNIAKTSANAKLLNFIVDKLFELKNLLFFYMENTYITKSYMENSVNYQQCLATLSMINKLFDEMRNKK